VAAACSGGAFAKAARQPVQVTPDLPDRVERLLRRSCLDLLGLARRAGQAVAGFEKTREWLERGQAAVLVCGIDAGPDGREKLGRAGAGRAAVCLLSGEELGKVFGRERVVHVALGQGNLAERFVREAARLAGFCGAPDLGKR
jgi:ribosomal protein L7Ae-like RNA K-turn-binding protein